MRHWAARIALAASSMLLLSAFAPASASALSRQDLPQRPAEPDAPDREITTVAKQEFSADVPAEKPHPIVEREGTTTTERRSAPCARIEQRVVASTPEGDDLYGPVCVAWWICGGERVDDAYSGNISGEGGGAMYARFLAYMIGLVLPDAAGEPGLTLPTEVNDMLLDQGLGDRPDDQALPIFYWCIHSDRDTPELTGTSIDLPGQDLGTRFGWDTTIETEYPIDIVRVTLLDELKEELGLWDPEPDAIPPLASGHTYVKFPTWFWLDNPLEELAVSSETDVGTIMIEMAGKLVRTEWHFGDGTSALVCDADEMLAYVDGVHDPIADEPPCSQRFDELDDLDLSVSIVYEVWESIRFRPSRSSPWPPANWQRHSAEPEVELVTDIGGHEVHELVALNVNDEQ